MYQSPVSALVYGTGSAARTGRVITSARKGPARCDR